MEKIPENMCIKLLKKYEDEQNVLVAELSSLEEKIAARKKTEQNIDEFIERIKKYRAPLKTYCRSGVPAFSRQIVQKFCRNTGVFQEIYVQYDG